MSRNRRVGTTELLVETGAVGKWLPRVTRTWHRVQSTAGESIHTGYLACLVRLAGISGDTGLWSRPNSCDKGCIIHVAGAGI